jgi:bifunctional DNA-binding transcriptional regulator/antitoxin component of YhaV-PrlF toxin-antitoxin module
MKNVVIIRDRGQLTIPDNIRKSISWVNPMSAVSISVVKADEIVIRPHQHTLNKERIWELIRKSRTIKGKNSQSAAEIIQADRLSR